MSNYTSTANIVLSVNGKQAQQWLNKLEKDAAKLEKQIEAAAAAGDKVKLKKLQKELNQTQRLMDQLKGTTNSVENTLQRLDKATPKELNKALRQLQNQLNGIERGSDAWNAHIEKIKALKEEISKVNESMRPDEDLMDRINAWWEKWQNAIVGAGAVITGLVMAGRSAVNAYAEMEQEMANVRKFTGMAAEEVAELNEEFKKMDTRTNREDLNKLAQEAGRLGKQSVEDVLGFVRAADKINVALDDLGAGATLTLSKLTGIFGDEKRLGTERSLLAVGSVINELSQNCSASAPYLSEFASRMGGVGSQAGLTVQQIMAFGAVLDSNNQACEASATALSQVITRIYQDPAKYAKVAGMDVAKFTKLVKTDMNGALLEFFGTLHKAGSMKVLSPMFKDMGENGGRAISAMSTLASKIADVTWQQDNANKAFSEATSIDNEFNVQNNTVQAGLEKAQYSVHELAVALGEKLQPAMKFCISSTTTTLKVMTAMVDFFIKYRVEVLTAISAIAVYNAVMLVLNTRTLIATAATKAFNVALAFGSKAVPALRLVLVPLINTIQYFTNGLQVNYAMQDRWRKAIAGMRFANWLGLVLAVAGAVWAVTRRMKENREEAERLRKEQEEYVKSLRNIDEGSADYSSKEIARLEAIYKAATDEKKSKEERIKAAEKLQRLYPDVFKNFSTEQIMLGQTATAYNKLRDSILEVARARAAADKIVENQKELLTLQKQAPQLKQALDAAEAPYLQAVAALESARQQESIRLNSYGNSTDAAVSHKVNLSAYENDVVEKGRAFEAARSAYNANQSRQRTINQSNAWLQNTYKGATEYLPKPEEMPNPEIPTLTEYSSVALQKQEERERKRAEAEAHRQEVKAKQEFKDALNVPKGEWESASAQNVTDYTAGLKSYTEFLEEKHRLDIKYFDDRMAVFEANGLQEDEDYQELLKKKAEAEAAWTERKSRMSVEDAKFQQGAEETQAQMDFYTPSSALFQNEEALQLKLHDIRIKYLGKMRDAYVAGSEEWVQYQQQIDTAEANEKLRIQQKLSQRVAEWKKQYEYLDAKTRLDMELELLNSAYEKKLLSEEEYQRAKADLAKEYKLKYLPDTAKPAEDSVNAESARMARELAIVDELCKQKILSEKEAEEAKDRIRRSYEKKQLQRARSVGSQEANQLLDIYEAWKSFFDKSGEDGENWATRLSKLMGGVFGYMNALMQSASEIMQAETDIEIAAVEKRYDREIELAEGNSYKVKKAEKEKEKEIARIKAEAQRKQFGMQLAMAVAQTAQNAIAAYGAGLEAGGPLGLALAPIAAAMAVAAGALQIASIVKQKQAAEAQGYSRGGFTKPGRVDEPAGVVHAGEWVASQKLVNSPRTRPLIDALEYAQRTNTIGSLNPEDVSRSITAPIVLASARQQSQQVVVQAPPASVIVQDNPELTSTLRELKLRLSEPFVTVNTVSGDHGIQKAQDDYAALLRNKSPKFKR